MLKAAFTLLRILLGLASLGALATTLLVIALFSSFTLVGNMFAPLVLFARIFTHGLQDPGPIPHHTYLYLLPFALFAALYLSFFISILTPHRRIFLHLVAAAAACSTVWTLASPNSLKGFWPILILWFAYYAICLFFNPISTGQPPPPGPRHPTP